MATFIFLLIIFLLIYLLLPAKKQKPNISNVYKRKEAEAQRIKINNILIEYEASQKSKSMVESKQAQVSDPNKEKAAELTAAIMEKLEFKIEITSSPSINNDSIIDVTGNDQPIPAIQDSALNSVPYWPHQYVYSYEEIHTATPAQKAFYQKFKQRFIQGEYLDVLGNSNYYFILLFDLLQESDKQPTLDLLENRLIALAEHYPKTAPYCRNFLLQKMQRRNDQKGLARIYAQNPFQTFPEYTYERLGVKFKKKLGLTDEEEKLVNKLWDPSNTFCNIEFCLLETIKLYLLLIRELEAFFIARHSIFEKEFQVAADKLAKQKFHYQANSHLYKFAFESASTDLYSMLFKHCENAIRQHYGHKRKINTDNYYSPQVKQIFEQKIIAHLPSILSSLLSRVSLPDEKTEHELNTQNTTRWKIAFAKLTDHFSGQNSGAFVDEVIKLGLLNKNNPSVENIFFEASKFIAKWNREAALKLYIHYIYLDLRSSTFDNKQFTKTVQKSLFKSTEEFQEFEKIVNALINDKDLDKALQSLKTVYTPKRKKINLDTSIISDVKQKHSSTVDLLDEILSDAEEDDKSSISTIATGNDEYKLEIVQTQPEVVVQTSLNGFSHVQSELLQVFYKNSFQVPQSEMESFARSHGMFISGLIDSLNESCYDKIDDVLIEEEEEGYIMNPDYYKLILAQ